MMRGLDRDIALDCDPNGRDPLRRIENGLHIFGGHVAGVNHVVKQDFLERERRRAQMLQQCFPFGALLHQQKFLFHIDVG